MTYLKIASGACFRGSRACAALISSALPLIFAAGACAANQSVPAQTVTLSADDTRGEDDSNALQKLINEVSSTGGGEVVIPAGRYGVGGIQMKDGVHIRAEEDVVFFPKLPNRQTNMFICGSADAKVSNVSFSGPDSRVVFDLTGDDIVADISAIRAFGITNCENFRLANFTVNDKETKFSSIILGWAGEENGVPKIGRNGVIENITANQAHYGYGAIQAHAGEKITFRNIESVGGVAVRLETGLIPMNKARSGGLYDIDVDTIRSINGQAALMFQPHTINHGKVVARNIKADGSEFAVLIARPFVSKSRYTEEDNLTVGSFESITIDGIEAIYREGPIVTRYVHLPYYPIEEIVKVTRVPSTSNIPSFRGPSIVAVNNQDDLSRHIDINNVQAIGYEYHPAIITKSDLDSFDIKTFPNLRPTRADRAAKAARSAKKKANHRNQDKKKKN